MRPARKHCRSPSTNLPSQARPEFPPVLFGWLEGNGAAAVAFMTGDPGLACFKCLRVELAGVPRFKLMRGDVKVETGRNLACGDAHFIPFPVSRAAVAADHSGDIALDWANGGGGGHKWRSLTIHPRQAIQIKDSNPKRTTGVLHAAIETHDLSRRRSPGDARRRRCQGDLTFHRTSGSKLRGRRRTPRPLPRTSHRDPGAAPPRCLMIYETVSASRGRTKAIRHLPLRNGWKAADRSASWANGILIRRGIRHHRGLIADRGKSRCGSTNRIRWSSSSREARRHTAVSVTTGDFSR